MPFEVFLICYVHFIISSILVIIIKSLEADCFPKLSHSDISPPHIICIIIAIYPLGV